MYFANKRVMEIECFGLLSKYEDKRIIKLGFDGMVKTYYFLIRCLKFEP